jgi:CRP-like cAMP-binding protein
MKTETMSHLAQKLSAYMTLSQSELQILVGLQVQRRTFAVGRDMIAQGRREQSIYILADGWACSYKILPNGLRQIIDFQIPGDFLGLRSVLLQTSDHCIEPVTALIAYEVNASKLFKVFEQSPRLAAAVLWAASRDEAMVVEHLIDIGRRNAIDRVGHYLLELGSRLALVGLGGKASYVCPLTQSHLADALGLSAVHVNRVLRQLREQGVLTFRDGRVCFTDRNRLIALVGFDPAYLDQDQPLLA